MTTPTEDFERRLRATLDRHAREAPPGAPLAERILLEVEAPVLRPRHGWRVWASPLLAAAAIAAAALALVGTNNHHLDAAPGPAATQPASPAPSHVPTAHRTASHAAPPPVTFTTTVRTAPTGGVRGFRAADVSFDSATEGWALGSATCVSGAGRCTEILHTTDAAHWSAAPKGEAFNVPGVKDCANPCVTDLRFANSSVGYAYGPDALFMTTDGGANWVRQPGLGADVLETVNGNVILVRAGGGPPLFRRANIGSSTWTPFSVPGFSLPAGGSVKLARAYGVTLLTATGYDPAKPASSPGAVYRSTDGGRSWTEFKRPCGVQSIGYRNSIAGATVGSGDGSLVVDCAVQTAADPVGFGSTVAAAPGTAHFVRPLSGGKVAPARLLAAPTYDIQLVVTGTGDLYRSADAGGTWSPLAQPSDVTFLGFRSGTDGIAVSDGGRALWATTDAGATWREVLFPQ